MREIHATTIRFIMQPVQSRIGDVAMRCCDHPSYNCIAFIDVLLRAGYKVIREGLNQLARPNTSTINF